MLCFLVIVTALVTGCSNAEGTSGYPAGNVTWPSNFKNQHHQSLSKVDTSSAVNTSGTDFIETSADNTERTRTPNVVSTYLAEHLSNSSFDDEISSDEPVVASSPISVDDSLFFSDYTNENASLGVEIAESERSNSTTIAAPSVTFGPSNESAGEIKPSSFIPTSPLSSSSSPETPSPLPLTAVPSQLLTTEFSTLNTATTPITTSKATPDTAATTGPAWSKALATTNAEKQDGSFSTTVTLSPSATPAGHSDSATLHTTQSSQPVSQSVGPSLPAPVWHVTNTTVKEVASPTAEVNPMSTTSLPTSKSPPPRYSRRKVVNAEMLGSKPVPLAEPANEDEDMDLREQEHSFLPATQSSQMVYFDFRRQCSEERAGDVWWNRTYGGVIAVRFCPDGYTGKVYRMCYYGGNWGEVDFSECRVQQLIKLKHLLYYHVHKNLTDGFHSLADELLSSLLRYSLRSVDDYLESLDSLNIIINARVQLDFDLGQDFKYLKIFTLYHQQTKDISLEETLSAKTGTQGQFPLNGDVY